MINRIINPLFSIATARRMAAIPLLAIALAFATLVTFQSGTAFADTGGSPPIAQTQALGGPDSGPGQVVNPQVCHVLIIVICT